MRLFAAALVAAFLFLLVPQPAIAQPLVWEGAIGRLETLGGGQCTFFIVDHRDVYPDWYSYNPPGLYLIVSAGHCYREEMWARLGPDRVRVWPQGYTSMAYGTDLMLGTFYSGNKYRVLPLAARHPQVGEWVRTVGFPKGVLRDVVMQAKMGVDPRARESIVLDVALSRGISGAPVLSLDGEVLGIVNMGTYKNPSRACVFVVCQTISPSYAIPIDELSALVQIGQK